MARILLGCNEETEFRGCLTSNLADGEVGKGPDLRRASRRSRPSQFKCSVVSVLFFYLGVPVLVLMLGLRIWSKLRSLVLPDSFERP